MMSVTRVTALTISPMVSPALSTSTEPVLTRPLPTESSIRPLDLLGRLRAALGQGTHFARHHREATALLAGARRFHRGVQRQDVGLEGDAVDHADDVGNLLRTAGDVPHGAAPRHRTTLPPCCAVSDAFSASCDA